ncbi:hypothetical protein CGLAU_11190 [Corynebacterium glaucum]|uniref:Golgi phosphoprotein 3 (GPP34) n=1 Tax=Corynebacterium glaucum TaxID=187491 RepID=A0A1Q2HZG0_9CORY|nr:GPP34 family phosphoprotein [Corynebacterium glaucum]AQQ16170.1 hypothetical protein CGLAU_11190 [Corynebacterium glaucum]WJZ08655.1 hypothetical protein CGLAUT_10995 [Corynebacterium glaucum]
MLIAEQVFLLLTNDKGGGEAWVSHRNLALNGALLCDLAAHNYIALERKRLSLRVSATVPSKSVQDPLLRHGVAELERKGERRLTSLLESGKFAQPSVVAQRFVANGVLAEEQKGFLFVNWNKYPTLDPSVEANLRARLQQTLHGQGQESWDEAVVLTLLDAIEAIGPVLKQETKGTKRRDRRETLGEIAYSLISPELERTGTLLSDTVQAVRESIVAIIEEERRQAQARARR